MEKAEAGRKKLEWERISESIRLNVRSRRRASYTLRDVRLIHYFQSPQQYVRSTLIEKTGQDIDPEEVENLVEREVLDIQKKRKQEELRVVQELRSGGVFRCRSRHGGI